MTIPIHRLHVFQRPMQGTSFIRRYDVYNYQHTIAVQGWFDTASCDIAVHSESEGQTILEQYLGCFVQVYVDHPLVPIWEGLINRVTFNSGGASYTRSLDEMANRMSCVFTAAANVGTETAVVNDLNSQAIYGIKQDQMEFGTDPTGGAATHRTVLRDTILAQRALPQTSIGEAQGETNLVHFELIGIFHTLEWTKLFVALTGATSAFGTRVGGLAGLDANGTTFYDNTDLTHISANAATTPQQQRGQSIWEVIQKIAEAGDGVNYWIAGINPTDPNTHKRTLYYRVANATIYYTALQKDGLKPRNAYGQPIPPWLVTPNRGIQVVDTLVGFGSSLYNDPRITYIQNIQYDANSQKVVWLGADDTTARAAFQLRRYFKPLSKNMPGSAPLRTIVT